MKTASHAALGFLAITLAAVPLSLAPGLYAFDITPKLLALGAGACLAWLFLVVSGTFSSIPRGFLYAIAGLAVCGVVSTVFSVDPVLSLAGSSWRRLGLPGWLACLAVCAAIPAVAGDARRRAVLLQAIAAAGVVAAIYGIAQYAGWDPWIDPKLYHIGEGEWQIVRPPSTLGYVSYFALYVAAATFIAAGLAVEAQSVPAKLAWSVGAICMTLALVVTGSRGAWLGAASGLAVLLVKSDRRRHLLFGLLAAVVLGAVFVASPLGLPVRSRMRWFVEDTEGGGRVQLWRESLQLGLSRPAAGTGLETFGREFSRVETAETAQLMRDFYAESPHNVFLDYLTSAGVPALACFLLLIGIALRTRDPYLLAALVAALITGQFIADTIPTRLLLLALAALGVSAKAPVKQPAWLRAAIGLLAVAGIAGELVYGVRLVHGDRAQHLAEVAARTGHLDDVLALAPRATDVYPFEYSRLVGQVAMLSGVSPAGRGFLLTLAENSARTAVAHSERPHSVHLQLASIAAMQQRYPDARSELEETIRLAPSWDLPRRQLRLLDSLARPGR